MKKISIKKVVVLLLMVTLLATSCSREKGVADLVERLDEMERKQVKVNNQEIKQTKLSLVNQQLLTLDEDENTVVKSEILADKDKMKEVYAECYLVSLEFPFDNGYSKKLSLADFKALKKLKYSNGSF